MSTVVAEPRRVSATRDRARAARSSSALHAVPVPTRRARPRVVYGLVAVGIAIAIVGAQMTLSVLTTQGSYRLAALTNQQRTLVLQKQVLGDQIAGLSSPQYLAANAAAAGMVIDQSPSYLRLSDGALLGAGGAAPGVSSVDPLGRGSVANKLVARTPLVTDPGATISGTLTPAAADSATPAPTVDSLPSISTH